MSGSGHTEIIEHDGIVQKTDSKSVTVKILSEAACSGCHAEGSCSLSGVKEKVLEVPGAWNVESGDNVTILMKKSAGYSAVLLGYVFPLILMVAALVLMISLKAPELAAGFVSILILVPYYFALWLFRKRISKNFTFTLKV